MKDEYNTPSNNSYLITHLYAYLPILLPCAALTK